MSAHVFHDREDGLSHCKTCGGAEASLPTECPGRAMTDAEGQAVMFGWSDYFAGQWTPPCRCLGAGMCLCAFGQCKRGFVL